MQNQMIRPLGTRHVSQTIDQIIKFMAFIDIIKLDLPASSKWLIHHFPGHDFNNNSSLIVAPGQIAICVYEGKIQQIITEGRTKLTTENYPFLRGIVKAVHGGDTPFTMDVYFINTSFMMEARWGTSEPVQVKDPEYGIIIHARGNGSYYFKISDYQLLLNSICGSLAEGETIYFANIVQMFSPIVCEKARQNLAEYLLEGKASALTLASKAEDFSEQIKGKIKDSILKYGFEIIDFFTASLSVKDEDLAIINRYIHEAQRFAIMGDKYEKSRSFDILEKAASSGGAGAMLMAGAVGQSGLASLQQNLNSTKQCPKCGVSNDALAKFCSNCGEPFLIKCPKCGKEHPSSKKFCDECGIKLN